MFHSRDWFTAGHRKVRVKINEETAMRRDREKENKMHHQRLFDIFFIREFFRMFYFSTWILGETVQDMGMRAEMEKKGIDCNRDGKREQEKMCESGREGREHMPLHCAKPGYRSNWSIGFIENICRAKQNSTHLSYVHILNSTCETEGMSQNERNSKLISCKCYLCIIIHISSHGARQG